MSGLLSGLWKPNTKGLYTGPLDGLNAFNAGAAAPTPIATWDWTPGDHGLDDPNYPSTYYWDLQEASGATTLVESKVGGGTHDLDADGGTTSFYTGQTAPGVYTGSPADGLSGRRCVESVYGAVKGDRFESSGTTLDLSQGSVAVRFRYRQLYLSGSYGFAGNNDFMLGSRAVNDGWGVFLQSNGDLNIQIRQGVNFSYMTVSAPTAGAWHDVEVQFDNTLREIRARIDGVAQTPVAYHASIVIGTLPSAPFTLFGSDTFHFNGLGLQIERIRGWEAGDGAESIHNTAWADVTDFGKDPLTGTAYEDDTISYTGAVPVYVGPALYYMASGDAGQFPVGYRSDLESRGLANGFTREMQVGLTNLAPESTRAELWTEAGGVSAVATDLSDGLLGFRSARKFTAATDNDVIYDVIATNTNNHRFWCWVKGDGKAVSGRAFYYDEIGASEGTSTTFTAANGEWTLVRMSWTPTSASTSVRIEIDTSGDSIWVDGYTLCETGELMHTIGFPIPTYGASAALDSTEGQASSIGNDAWNEEKGCVEFGIYMPVADVTTRDVWTNTRGTLANRLILDQTAVSGQIRGRFWDNAPASVAIGSPTGVNPENGYRVVFTWDSTAPVAGANHTRIEIIDDTGSTVIDAQTSTWDTSGAEITTQLFNAFWGAIGYCRIYDQPYLSGEI